MGGKGQEHGAAMRIAATLMIPLRPLGSDCNWWCKEPVYEMDEGTATVGED